MRSPAMARSTIPLVRMPDRRTRDGGVAVDVAGAGEIAGARRVVRSGGSVRARRFCHGRESPSMIAFRLRPLAGHRSSRARPSSSCATRRRPCSSPTSKKRVTASSLRRDGRLLVEARYAHPQQPASFLKLLLPAGCDRVERGGRAAARFVRALAEEAIRPPAAREGPRRPGCAHLRRRARLPAAQRASWPEKGRASVRLAGARSADVTHWSCGFSSSPRSGRIVAQNCFVLAQDRGPFAERGRKAPPMRAGGRGQVEARRWGAAVSRRCRCLPGAGRSLP